MEIKFTFNVDAHNRFSSSNFFFRKDASTCLRAHKNSKWALQLRDKHDRFCSHLCFSKI